MITSDKDSVVLNNNEGGETPKNQEETPPQSSQVAGEEGKEVDYKDELVKSYDPEKNKAFAQLRQKEKALKEAEEKIKSNSDRIVELEGLISKGSDGMNKDEKAKFDEWYQEKVERERIDNEQRHLYVSQKETDLSNQGLNKSQVNEVFKIAVEYTGGDVDKAFKLYSTYNKIPAKDKINMNFSSQTNTSKSPQGVDATPLRGFSALRKEFLGEPF